MGFRQILVPSMEFILIFTLGPRLALSNIARARGFDSSIAYQRSGESNALDIDNGGLHCRPIIMI